MIGTTRLVGSFYKIDFPETESFSNSVCHISFNSISTCNTNNCFSAFSLLCLFQT
ncbi:hypothetical protein MtrunA17_Chr2g0287791 [Medicago truncatula]|uniref:Uncharacterized protein n=1 Tax=Medicago truncatula TaxID=3880 RepID=A0A396J7A1_MEDTR|nr:hypothetical protein MtrunA17_Chr2g0287791 [Medicago truncatula]